MARLRSALASADTSLREAQSDKAAAEGRADEVALALRRAERKVGDRLCKLDRIWIQFRFLCSNAEGGGWRGYEKRACFAERCWTSVSVADAIVRVNTRAEGHKVQSPSNVRGTGFPTPSSRSATSSNGPGLRKQQKPLCEHLSSDGGATPVQHGSIQRPPVALRSR